MNRVRSAAMVAPRRAARDKGDTQLAGFVGTVVGALFAAYLIWSTPFALTAEALSKGPLIRAICQKRRPRS